MMIPMSGTSARSRRHVSIPEAPGRLMSSSTRSRTRQPIISMACSPLLVVSTGYPQADSEVCSTFCMDGSSSTTRMLNCCVDISQFPHGDWQCQTERGSSPRSFFLFQFKAAIMCFGDFSRYVQSQTRSWRLISRFFSPVKAFEDLCLFGLRDETTRVLHPQCDLAFPSLNARIDLGTRSRILAGILQELRDGQAEKFRVARHLYRIVAVLEQNLTVGPAARACGYRFFH